MVRLLWVNWVCAECLGESTLGITSNLDLAMGEAVELVESVYEGDNAEDAPEFTAVGGAKDAAGVSWRGLVHSSGKNDRRVSNVSVDKEHDYSLLNIEKETQCYCLSQDPRGHCIWDCSLATCE